MTDHLPIFVYGTLKRGQKCEPLWPRKPVRVEVATTLGRLFDLGPYPALVPGDNVVAGELWHVMAGDASETLAKLDAIEEVGAPGGGLYERRVVTCRNEAGQMLKAWTYLYARCEELSGQSPLKSGGDGCCRWPDRKRAREVRE